VRIERRKGALLWGRMALSPVASRNGGRVLRPEGSTESHVSGFKQATV